MTQQHEMHRMAKAGGALTGTAADNAVKGTKVGAALDDRGRWCT